MESVIPESIPFGTEESYLYIAGIFIIIAIITTIFNTILNAHRNHKIKQKILALANNEVEMTPAEFFEVRNTKMANDRRKNISSSYKFAGIYILFNKTKNMYYVGQGIHVMNRVNSHFTGKGNGDVYADYKYGDEFSIRIIGVLNSGFENLNQLERETIRTYEAYSRGYNKTRGNKSRV